LVRIPGHGITTLSLLISRSSRLLSRPPNRDGFRRVLSLLFVLCGGTVPGPVSSTPERRDALLNTRTFRDLRVPPLSDTQSFRATPFEFQTGSIRKGDLKTRVHITGPVRLGRATLRTCPRRTDQADKRHIPSVRVTLWTIRRAPGAGVSIRDEITDGSGKRKQKKKNPRVGTKESLITTHPALEISASPHLGLSPDPAGRSTFLHLDMNSIF